LCCIVSQQRKFEVEEGITLLVKIAACVGLWALVISGPDGFQCLQKLWLRGAQLWSVLYINREFRVQNGVGLSVRDGIHYGECSGVSEWRGERGARELERRYEEELEARFVVGQAGYIWPCTRVA